MVFLRNLLLIAWCCIYAPMTFAALTIEITEGVESALPVAVVPFASSGAPVDISAVVNADLERSGYFKCWRNTLCPIAQAPHKKSILKNGKP